MFRRVPAAAAGRRKLTAVVAVMSLSLSMSFVSTKADGRTVYTGAAVAERIVWEYRSELIMAPI